MKLVFISDVHEQWQGLEIPPCDVLVSCGDYSYRGARSVVVDFHRWLSAQPAGHVVSVQGNHELWVEGNFSLASDLVHEIDPRIQFLHEGSVVLGGLKIYCASVTPEFGGWAWNVARGERIRRHWAVIPEDTEVLVTHGPPYGILDQAAPDGSVHRREGQYLGCADLLARVQELPCLRIHAFGHIHGSSGKLTKPRPRATKSDDQVLFVNAAICDESYQAVNCATVVELF